jgi:hypothetical protein
MSLPLRSRLRAGFLDVSIDLQHVPLGRTRISLTGNNAPAEFMLGFDKW